MYLGLFLFILTNFFNQLSGGIDSPMFWFTFLLCLVVFAKTQDRETVVWTAAFILSFIFSALIKGKTNFVPVISLSLLAILVYFYSRYHSQELNQLKINLTFLEAKQRYLARKKIDQADANLTSPELEDYPQIERPIVFFLKFLHQCFAAYSTCIFGYTQDKLLGDSPGELILIAGFSESDNFMKQARIKMGQGVVGIVGQERKEILIRDYYEAPDRLGYYSGENSIRSVMGAPVVFGKELEGVIVVDRKRDVFNEEERELLRISAVTFAHLLGMLRSYEKKRYEASYFSSLYELIKQLQKELTLDRILEISLDSTLEVLGCDSVAIASVDLLNNEGVIRGAKSNLKTGLTGKLNQRFRLDEGLVGWVANFGGYLIKDDLKAGKNFRFAKNEGSHSCHSFLGVPVRDDNRVIAVLWAESRMRNKFSETDAEFMNFLAAQLSLAWLRANLYHQVKELSIRDSLTGLYNHRQFQEILKAALEKARTARGEKGELILLLLDVDHFKSINDRYGHPIGDEVLKKVARIIGEAPGEAARYGGEEFALVLGGYALKRGVEEAVRIRDKIGKHKFKVESEELSITLSIGISHFPKDAKDRGKLIEKADSALYLAKRMGRDRVVLAQTNQVVGESHKT